jgi:hypothetical protein
MSDQSPESRQPADREDLGSLSVEDDPAGTEDPAELAGTAKPDDARPASQPSVSEADRAGEEPGGPRSG